MLRFFLDVFAMWLAYHLDYFMQLSVSAESRVTGIICRVEDAEKIAFEVEKRALDTEH